MPHARFHNDIPEKYRRQNYPQFGRKKGQSHAYKYVKHNYIYFRYKRYRGMIFLGFSTTIRLRTIQSIDMFS